ncbi:hypothetical protein NMY22_g19807 [Coprinellus aureogranulatus]|nr:hypothetical protein NMY22_g19807 [Coprinellus aureogranulatus]
MSKTSSPRPSISLSRPRRQIRIPARYRDNVYSQRQLSHIYGAAALPKSPYQSTQELPVDSEMRDVGEGVTVDHPQPAFKLEEAEAPMEIDAPQLEDAPDGRAGDEPSDPSIPEVERAPAQDRLTDLVTRRRYERLERELRLEVEVQRANAEELKKKLDRLERSERRLKNMLNRDREKLADRAVELEEARRALEKSEEKLDQKNETIKALTGDVKRYRSWWLNEYYCLKVTLELVRNPKDAGVQAMKESSHARYMTCFHDDWREEHKDDITRLTLVRSPRITRANRVRRGFIS